MLKMYSVGRPSFQKQFFYPKSILLWDIRLILDDKLQEPEK
jgi:hypothetical protein